jgi:hypothetical protein
MKRNWKVFLTQYGNRLSGSARFFIFGAHFFHLDFILAQYGYSLNSSLDPPEGVPAPEALAYGVCYKPLRGLLNVNSCL